jgi:Helix-turn-helix.
MKLSMRIRIARRRARLSQEALAINLGVTRSAVANWECADGVLPASARLARLAELTSVNFEWLATGRGAIDHAGNEENVPAVDGELVYDERERRLLAVFRRMTERARLETLMQWESTFSAASQKEVRTR